MKLAWILPSCGPENKTFTLHARQVNGKSTITAVTGAVQRFTTPRAGNPDLSSIKRALTVIAVLIGLACPVSTHAFGWSLPKFDFSDFELPKYDWSPSKFEWATPDTWPFIPIPMVATDPNGGTTYGVLPVVLFTKRDRIVSIFAPDITKNTTLGGGGDFRYLAYPSSDTRWYVEGGAQKTIARYVDLDYQTGRDRNKMVVVRGPLLFRA